MCNLLTIGIGILDKGKAFRLLRVVIPRDVDIADLTDAPKRHTKVVVGDVGPDVAHQQGDSRNALPLSATTTAATASTPTTTTTTTSASTAKLWATPSAPWAVGIAAPRARRAVGIVIRIVVGRWTTSPAAGASPGRPVIVASAPIVIPSTAATVIIGRSATPVAAGGSSPIAVIVSAAISVVSSSL